MEIADKSPKLEANGTRSREWSKTQPERSAYLSQMPVKYLACWISGHGNTMHCVMYFDWKLHRQWWPTANKSSRYSKGMFRGRSHLQQNIDQHATLLQATIMSFIFFFFSLHTWVHRQLGLQASWVHHFNKQESGLKQKLLSHTCLVWNIVCRPDRAVGDSSYWNVVLCALSLIWCVMYIRQHPRQSW